MSGVTARVRMVAASLVLGLAFSFAPAVPAQAVLVNVIQDTLFTWGLKQAGGGALGQIGGFFVREITGIGRDRSPEILAQLDEIQAQLGEVSSQLRDLQADVSSIQSELRAARSEDDVAMINAYTAELINFNNVRLTPLVNATVNLGRADYSGDSTAIATAVARFQVQRAAHVDYWDTVNACVAARCFSLRLAVISIAQQLIPPPPRACSPRCPHSAGRRPGRATSRRRRPSRCSRWRGHSWRSRPTTRRYRPSGGHPRRSPSRVRRKPSLATVG